MTNPTFTKEERKRFEKISNVFGWRFSVSVKEMFNRAGKYQAFAAAPTEEEKKAQMGCTKYIFTKDSDYYSLKMSDMFLEVARRVNQNDAELAALVPKDKLDANDLALLEKYDMKALAAVVKLAL